MEKPAKDGFSVVLSSQNRVSKDLDQILILRVWPVRCLDQRVADISRAFFEQDLVHRKPVGLGELRGEGHDRPCVALPERMDLPQLGDQL